MEGGGVRGIFFKVNLSCEFNKFEWHLYSTIQRSIVLYSELILEVSSIPYHYHYYHFQQGRIYYYVPASRVFWKIHPPPPPPPRNRCKAWDFMTKYGNARCLLQSTPFVLFFLPPRHGLSRVVRTIAVKGKVLMLSTEKRMQETC